MDHSKAYAILQWFNGHETLIQTYMPNFYRFMDSYFFPWTDEYAYRCGVSIWAIYGFSSVGAPDEVGYHALLDAVPTTSMGDWGWYDRYHHTYGLWHLNNVAAAFGLSDIAFLPAAFRKLIFRWVCDVDAVSTYDFVDVEDLPEVVSLYYSWNDISYDFNGWENSFSSRLQTCLPNLYTSVAADFLSGYVTIYTTTFY